MTRAPARQAVRGVSTVTSSASGLSTSAPTAAVFIVTLGWGARSTESSLSIAVIVTVPLSVASAGIVSDRALSVTRPGGEALTGTVTGEETALDSLAFSVVALPVPLSLMRADPSTSETRGLGTFTVMTGETA